MGVAVGETSGVEGVETVELDMTVWLRCDAFLPFAFFFFRCSSSASFSACSFCCLLSFTFFSMYSGESRSSTNGYASSESDIEHPDRTAPAFTPCPKLLLTLTRPAAAAAAASAAWLGVDGRVAEARPAMGVVETAGVGA